MVMNDHPQVDSFSESVESVKKKEKDTGLSIPKAPKDGYM